MSRIKMTKTHPHQDLPCNIVRFYRGRLSQNHFSKKLGYSYNAVYRWEANIKPISWNELIDLV
nr:helix-turn-helix transcriptional regulator [Pseudobdellovibrionaceae bacterium]